MAPATWILAFSPANALVAGAARRDQYLAVAGAKNFGAAPLHGRDHSGTRAGLGAAACRVIAPKAAGFGLALAGMEPLSDLTVSGT